ncbi:MAG: hypothetical protein CMN98_01030 [Synechococcus sp. NP17]|nr:hypothetical protein [Synechococcus sp. NP17]
MILSPRHIRFRTGGLRISKSFPQLWFVFEPEIFPQSRSDFRPGITRPAAKLNANSSSHLKSVDQGKS